MRYVVVVINMDYGHEYLVPLPLKLVEFYCHESISMSPDMIMAGGCLYTPVLDQIPRSDWPLTPATVV